MSTNAAMSRCLVPIIRSRSDVVIACLSSGSPWTGGRPARAAVSVSAACAADTPAPRRATTSTGRDRAVGSSGIQIREFSGKLNPRAATPITVTVPIDRERRSDCAGVRAKTVYPQVVRNHEDARSGIRGSKRPTDVYLDTQHGKELVRDFRRLNTIRNARPGDGDEAGVVRAGRRPGSFDLLQRRERVDRWARPPRGLAVREVERDEPVRVSERQRLERNPVQHGEARRRGTDAQRQRHDDNQDEARMRRELPHGNAKSWGRALMLTATQQPACRTFGAIGAGSEAPGLFGCAVVGNERSTPNSRHVPQDVGTGDSGLGIQNSENVGRDGRARGRRSRSAQLQVSRATNPTSSSFCR